MAKCGLFIHGTNLWTEVLWGTDTQNLSQCIWLMLQWISNRGLLFARGWSLEVVPKQVWLYWKYTCLIKSFKSTPKSCRLFLRTFLGLYFLSVQKTKSPADLRTQTTNYFVLVLHKIYLRTENEPFLKSLHMFMAPIKMAILYLLCYEQVTTQHLNCC